MPAKAEGCGSLHLLGVIWALAVRYTTNQVTRVKQFQWRSTGRGRLPPQVVHGSVPLTSSSDTVNGPRKQSLVQGRPCAEKYRRVGNHSACLLPSQHGVPIELEAEEIKLIVDTHNHYRSTVNPPAANMLQMSWDDEIAMIAQAWAETCSLGHDEARNRDIPGRLSLGQNVGQGFPSWIAIIDAWFLEARHFTHGDHTNVFDHTGHYTQGVWADSNKLGCGASHCGDVIFYVCNYGPAGNIEPFYTPYKTGESCADCPLHCQHNLCACDHQVCQNGGSMDRHSCRCKCPHRWLVGRQCQLDCGAVTEPKYCGRKPFDRDGCDLYENVPHDCPSTCRVCPDENEKLWTLPALDGSNNNNDDSTGGDDASTGTVLHTWHVHHVLCLCVWGPVAQLCLLALFSL